MCLTNWQDRDDSAVSTGLLEPLSRADTVAIGQRCYRHRGFRLYDIQDRPVMVCDGRVYQRNAPHAPDRLHRGDYDPRPAAESPKPYGMGMTT